MPVEQTAEPEPQRLCEGSRCGEPALFKFSKRCRTTERVSGRRHREKTEAAIFKQLPPEPAELDWGKTHDWKTAQTRILFTDASLVSV